MADEPTKTRDIGDRFSETEGNVGDAETKVPTSQSDDADLDQRTVAERENQKEFLENEQGRLDARPDDTPSTYKRQIDIQNQVGPSFQFGGDAKPAGQIERENVEAKQHEVQEQDLAEIWPNQIGRLNALDHRSSADPHRA